MKELRELFPRTAVPAVTLGGRRFGPGLPDAHSWLPAQRLLAHVRTVSPHTPGLARLERAIGRATGGARTFATGFRSRGRGDSGAASLRPPDEGHL